ncbi:MAG TPA: helix-turn-helix domain-containing protein [Thermoanaerobaculia bacterium]|nr:helix-turn-helix domain-containing protein [Thermoanaerobaculia bacterium]
MRKKAKKPRPPRSETLAVLRTMADVPQTELADAAGVKRRTVNDCERGDEEPSLATVYRYGELLGHPAYIVDRTLALVDLRRGAAEAPAGGGEPGGPVRARVEELTAQAGSAVPGFLRFKLTGLAARALAEAARRQARADWAHLQRHNPARQRFLLQQLPALPTWALCELCCEESERAAADDAKQALALAELALFVAGLLAGEESWRSRLQGYAGAFVGNARRVGSDLKGAERAFLHCAKLWRPANPGDPDDLDDSRVLDLEASLRRAQRQLPRALALLDRALAICRGGAAVGRILVNKAKTLEELGEYEAALLALGKAEPFIDKKQEPLLYFALRSNVIVNLCHLGRCTEAEPLLGEVRDLSGKMANRLGAVRLRWLEGRIAAGLGRVQEAIQAFLQVRGEFASHRMAYDAALVSLELAEVYAAEHRTGDVKTLARQMAPIFQAQDVHREALAAIALFRRAAEEERVTVELARRLFDYLRRARHDAELRFEAVA